MTLKLKATYIIAGAVIISAAAIPLASFAQTNSGKHLARNNSSIHANFRPASRIKGQQAINGTVTAISGTNITVTATGGTVYSVDASAAKLLKFGASGLSLSNIQVGDKITVMGMVTGTSVSAKDINDQSFVGRDVFMGKVTAINGAALTINSMTKSASTVYTIDVGSAVLTKGATTAITLANISVGDQIVAIGALTGTNVKAVSLMDLGAGKMDKKDKAEEKPAITANIHSGTVTAINGNSITIDSMFGKTKTTYAVDASTAVLTKGRGTGMAIVLSNIAVGDRLMITGPLSGTSIKATAIRDLGAKKSLPAWGHKPKNK